MDANDYRLIDAYLQKELPPDQLPAFQQRLASDATFAAELALRQNMNNYLRTQAHQHQLEEKMATLGPTYFGERAANLRHLNARYWIMGLVAAVVAVLLVVWNPLRQPDLYHEFAQHQPLNLTEKSTAGQLAAAAEASFNAGNYEAAYRQLTTYLQETPADNQARLALGIAALETDRVPEAQAIFTAVAAGDSVFRSYGTWYLALSYLKVDAKTAAKATLEKIPTTDPDFGARAIELRRALE
ncbi:MAG: hypothetical protein DA408_00810 [Bacteroidetes bacterium]|nr:MAG: hypothetical protein DA408_00810 [Bacteroidota bacterium]